MNVKVYSTPSCIWCTKLKEYLTSNNVAFEAIDISADREAAKDLAKRAGQMVVPITDIDGELIIGFDKEKIDAKLGL